MRAEHTPGPWVMLTEPVQGEDWFLVGDDGDEVVANILPGHDSEDSAWANAHLISSAPEMLEALKILARPHFLAKHEQDLVDKAIAHAEGRELGMEAEA